MSFFREFEYLKVLALVCILLLSNLFGVSQTKNIEDSLLFELAEMNKDTERVNLLFNLINFYKKNGDINRAQGFSKQALALSKELGFTYGEAKANYLLSSLINTFDSDLAQSYVLESLELAKKIKDSLLIADCYNVIGIIFNEKKQYDRALYYYNMSLDITMKKNDTKSISKIYNNMGVVYGNMLKDSLALKFFIKAARLNKKYKNYLWNSINYENLGRLYFKKDSVKKAFYYYKLAENMIIHHNFASSIPWLCNNYSYSYYNMQEYDKSIFYADSSYNYSKYLKNNTTLASALSLLKDAYSAKGDISNALYYANELLELKDTIHQKEKNNKIVFMELKYVYEKEQKIKNLKARNDVLKLWLVIGGLFIAVFLLYILLRLQLTKTKNSKLGKEVLALEKDNLNKELDLKNRELTSKIISLIDKSELIETVIEKLSQTGLHFKVENRKHIQSLVSSLRIHQKSDMWNEFEKTFTAIHPVFYKRLQKSYPTLTNKELRLCAYLKLNMSSKEISNLMHLNINSVETARSRLRKKLNITGSDISLYSFIAKF